MNFEGASQIKFGYNGKHIVTVMQGREFELDFVVQLESNIDTIEKCIVYVTQGRWLELDSVDAIRNEKMHCKCYARSRILVGFYERNSGRIWI